jgi:hypothetical protein
VVLCSGSTPSVWRCVFLFASVTRQNRSDERRGCTLTNEYHIMPTIRSSSSLTLRQALAR